MKQYKHFPGSKISATVKDVWLWVRHFFAGLMWCLSKHFSLQRDDYETTLANLPVLTKAFCWALLAEATIGRGGTDRSVGWTPDHESRQAIARQSWFFSYIVWRIGMFSPSSAHTGTLYKYSRWIPHTAKYPKMPRKFSTSKERGTSWSGQQKDLSLAAHTAACSLFLALSPTVLSADQLWWLGKTRRWKVNSGEVVVLPPKFAG